MGAATYVANNGLLLCPCIYIWECLTARTGNEPDLNNKNFRPGMNATILAEHFKQFFALLELLYPDGTGDGTPVRKTPFPICKTITLPRQARDKVAER
jgi:hypothetical protein